ncbi:serine/threonine-protein kinase [Kutzneria buriramensis]|uniref:non-specific serine/threonine protein kinase n=1 Tax=Kutzneria buriramensis TaxID=1045776 RepID=A0A3E0H0V1_9PSEU|nr:serine/threonine-protein kinase [Kutzneria buriramensis]REH36261.1 serine/threonine protein kinase [Kutzneria buriramensis]
MATEGDLIAERYKLVRKVGSGAMGTVWQARDQLLRRDVAVKELLVRTGMTELQTDEARNRAMREARLAARLHHPNVISIYDVVEYEGRPCLIMEYLPSSSLADLIAEQGVLPVGTVARIGTQIASALAAAHTAGIVHRDVKPANVLLTGDNVAKLTDFGISRADGDATVTAAGLLAGTPAYLPPEVAQGEDATFASDVYSLGAMLYAAVEGKPPFGTDDNAVALLHRIATEEVPPPEHAVPLTATLVWMLRRDPKHRPEAKEVQDALGALAETMPAEMPAPAPVPAEPVEEAPAATAEAPDRRRGVAIALVLGAVIVAVIVVVYALNQPQPSGTAGGPSSTTRATSTAPKTSTTTPAPTTTSTTNPPATTTTTSSVTTNPPADVATQLVNAINDYYKLMPNDLQDGWNRMTADYQQNKAHGFAGYQSYWQQFSAVSLANVTATLPNTVTADITYTYKNGGTTTEHTTFGMVQQDGIWKIASS